MRRFFCLLLLTLVAGCATAPAPAPTAAPDETTAPPPRRIALPLPPPPPSPAFGDADVGDGAAIPAPATPRDILLAADQARADAYGYVAWKKSKAETIDRLTSLMRALNRATDRMRTGQVHGRYAPADVRAARTAVDALRGFLANKDD